MEPIYEVVWPRSPRGVQARRPAERLSGLDGNRIAFLWDYVFRGDELFPVLQRELEQRYPNIEIVGYEDVGNTHGPDEAAIIDALPQTLSSLGVDAVVSGVGC